MDNKQIAQELVRIAKEMTGGNLDVSNLTDVKFAITGLKNSSKKYIKEVKKVISAIDKLDKDKETGIILKDYNSLLFWLDKFDKNYKGLMTFFSEKIDERLEQGENHESFNQ